ncbi:hypothetical protein SAMN06272781_8256 [Streptomyces sp. 1222.2]|nr:hypothetical protein SAMN06272781_8256 [Streptomyces sp. 1222.2]
MCEQRRSVGPCTVVDRTDSSVGAVDNDRRSPVRTRRPASGGSHGVVRAGPDSLQRSHHFTPLRPRHPLTPPAVRPLIRWRSTKTNSTTTGTTAISEEAKRYCHCSW